MSDYVPGDTALIVPVPQAEPAVGGWRARHDESVRHGVPAHVTVLVPFLPAERIDTGVVDALGALVRAVPRFDVRFTRCARFPDGVLYLEPDPEAPFRELTGAIAARWPEAPPYRGQFEDVVPHLTIARADGVASFDAIEADVRTRLPVEAAVTAVELLVFDGAMWVPRRTFPLGAA